MKTMDELYKQCKKLQIFIFSKKTEKIKSLKKNSEKKCASTPIYTYYCKYNERYLRGVQ